MYKSKPFNRCGRKCIGNFETLKLMCYIIVTGQNNRCKTFYMILKNFFFPKNFIIWSVFESLLDSLLELFSFSFLFVKIKKTTRHQNSSKYLKKALKHHLNVSRLSQFNPQSTTYKSRSSKYCHTNFVTINKNFV